MELFIRVCGSWNIFVPFELELLLLFSVLIGRSRSSFPGLKDACLEMKANHIQSPYLYSFLAEIYEEESARNSDSYALALEVEFQ